MKYAALTILGTLIASPAWANCHVDRGPPCPVTGGTPATAQTQAAAAFNANRRITTPPPVVRPVTPPPQPTVIRHGIR
ncbi:hypothetical protein [Methylobacterium aquaticum]|jgi:hypothetical protein|uniref:Uncharacterized protein n=1 Tax=Methylobacterium aquaticum TaxID=270351 RepID=A0A0J6S465_9HYPH|nr:hypothetical protein [Methylobacterium aquaticum]KMO28459.1 hypothetical protein VP06_27425 [Methylobacterium aquaticum]